MLKETKGGAGSDMGPTVREPDRNRLPEVTTRVSKSLVDGPTLQHAANQESGLSGLVV